MSTESSLLRIEQRTMMLVSCQINFSIFFKMHECGNKGQNTQERSLVVSQPRARVQSSPLSHSTGAPSKRHIGLTRPPQLQTQSTSTLHRRIHIYTVRRHPSTSCTVPAMASQFLRNAARAGARASIAPMTTARTFQTSAALRQEVVAAPVKKPVGAFRGG